MNKLLLLFPLAIGMISFMPGAFAESAISITSPQYDQTLNTATVLIQGTYRESPLKQTTDLTYDVQISIDGGALTDTTFSNGQWAYEPTLADGWHTAKVMITDSTGSFAIDQTQFLTLTAHFTPSRFNMILIEYSEACQKMIDKNMTSSCPTLDKLAPFDTTNQTYAGKIIKQNGEWVRTKPMISQYWNFFTGTGKNIVCVACDFDFNYISTVPIIFIEPTGFIYPQTDPNAGTNITKTYWNGTAYVNYQVLDPVIELTHTIAWNRYVSPDCMSANEVYSQDLLADTIYYMDSKCTASSTKINNTATLIPQSMTIDYAHSPQYIYQKWLQNAKSSSANNCITKQCNEIKDATSNSNFATGGK